MKQFLVPQSLIQEHEPWILGVVRFLKMAKKRFRGEVFHAIDKGAIYFQKNKLNENQNLKFSGEMQLKRAAQLMIPSDTMINAGPLTRA